MPNHVINHITFKGEQEDIDKVFSAIIGVDREGKEIFDFNKIVPRPTSLNIESSSRTDEAYKYYMAKTFTADKWDRVILSPEKFILKIERV